MEFSVVIPIFNEGASLKILQEELEKVMKSISASYEIIYINDASKDESLKILKELKLHSPQIRIISFGENKGQSAALAAGFRQARGRWVITLDGDLQNPPQEIIKLLEFKDNYDCVTGIRRERKDSFLRRFSSHLAQFLRRLILKDTTKDTGCSLRIFKREIINEIPLFKNFHRFFIYLLKIHDFRVKEIPVAHRPRKFGKSRYLTLKRAWEGCFDLWGVFWLSQRKIRYETEDED